MPQPIIEAELMAVFGSWSDYRTAPVRVVQEQIEVWRARKAAEADDAREAEKKRS